jgi:hypothetical protein
MPHMSFSNFKMFYNNTNNNNLHVRVHTAFNNTCALAQTKTLHNQPYYQLYESPPEVTRLTVYCRAHIWVRGLVRARSCQFLCFQNCEL